MNPRWSAFGILFLIGLPAAGWSSSYEAQLPALAGGALAGYAATVVVNRTPSAQSVQVQLIAEEKDTGVLYTYPLKQAAINGQTFNAVTGEIESNGKTSFTWDLQQANFSQFARLTVRISTPADPPSITWVAFVTGRVGTAVLCWADIRKFRKL